MDDPRALIDQALSETDTLIEQNAAQAVALDQHHRTLTALAAVIPPEPEPPEPEPEPDPTILLGQPGDEVLILPKTADMPAGVNWTTVDGNGHCDLVQVSWPLSYWRWYRQDDGSVYGVESHASGQKVTLRNLTYIRDAASAPSTPLADLPFEGAAPPDGGNGPAPPDGEFEPLPPVIFPAVTAGDITVEIEWTAPDPERIGRRGRGEHRGRHGRGVTLDFAEAEGEDLGEFVPDAPFSHGARMVRVRHPDSPLYVLIVRDRSEPERYWQVWFQNFALWGDHEPADLPGYHATIRKAGAVVASYDVDRHYWAGQWRHVSEAWPLVRQPPACLDWVLEMDPTAVRGVTPLATAPLYVPMQVKTMTKSMGDTGDRGEIGLYTEFQGEWLASGNPRAYEAMIVQDEEGACFPMGWIDEHAGRPVSLADYPTIDSKDGSGSPYKVPTIACELTLDTGHMPGFGFVAYLASEDPWHLWLLQCNVTWAWFNYHQQYREQEKGRIGYEQTRSYFWQLRSLARAAKISPANPPAWLLGRDYFAERLEHNRENFTRDFVEDPTPLHAVLRQAVQTPADYEGWSNQQTAPWQEEFGVVTLAEICKNGFDTWDRALVWKADSSIARFSERDGWPRAFGCPYRIIVNLEYGAPFAESWAEALAMNDELGNLDEAHCGDEWIDWWNYWCYARAAHCALVQLDMSSGSAEDNLEWFAAQHNRPDNWTPWRWAFRAP